MDDGAPGPNPGTTSASVSRRRRALLPAAVLAALVLTLAWASGLMRFAAAIPTAVGDIETPTDAIVVLTGGSERLATGVSLLDRGLAQRVFVSGVHPGVDTRAMLDAVGEPRPDLLGRIETGHGARDTAGNARETAAWIRGHGYRSLRLVTASYHMPRSMLEFGRALPEATILAHPVFPSHVMQARWWLWPGTAGLIIGEYHKFLWSWLRLKVVHVADASARRSAGGAT
ncbi:MAG: YdcF family protein [Rhodospirillales bacterium]